MSDKPAFLRAKENGEFFDITDEFYETIDHEKHEQFLRNKESKEEE